MSEQRIGTCSLCGGDVRGYVGAWWGITPPPPAKCVSCNAVVATDVIPMVRPAGWHGLPTTITQSPPSAAGEG